MNRKAFKLPEDMIEEKKDKLVSMKMSTFQLLEDEAKTVGITSNKLISQVLDDYAQWDSRQEKKEMIKVMNDLINFSLALLFGGAIISGVYYGPQKLSQWVKEETVKKVRKGTFSLEAYTEKLTGKKLDI
jgi:hypothetical protein